MAEKILKAVEFEKCSAKFKKQYADEQALWERGWLLQPKYDGCYGMAVMRFGGGSQMLSRTGEDYTKSCGHILEELREAADEQSGSWDDFVVLGEVWHPTWKFPAISGKFRKQAPCDELVFKANDILPPGLVTDTPYAQRLNDLLCLLPDIENAVVVASVVDRLSFTEAVRVTALAKEYVDQGGYDGLILRDLRAPYTLALARDGQIVKVKPGISLDLKVQRIASGLGEKTGRVVYTIVVEYRGVASFVGSGVPHVLNFEVGDIVEVEAMGLTEDGKLREPRFKGVRHDKTEQDE